MMNVSAPGGLSDSSANSHKNGHSGPGFARQRRIGRPGRTFGPSTAAIATTDGHGQRREEDVLEHGIAEERHARLSSS